MPINMAFQRLKKPRKDGFPLKLNTIYSRDVIKKYYILYAKLFLSFHIFSQYFIDEIS